MTEKMKSVIREITLNEATFHGQVIEPTYVNFFYGRNGAGKSTVARAIEHNDGLEWQNGHVADDFDVLVYSQDFINRNFATYGNLRGVFTISETNIEIQKQVEEKSNQKNELEAKAGNYTEEKTKKDGEQFVIRKTFEDGCWKKTRDICDTFKDAVKGTGTKKLFADAVLSVKTPKEYNLEALAKLYHVAYNSDRKSVV